MTVSHRTLDPVRLAAAARSILSCPDAAQVVVDGVDDVLAGDAGLGLQDVAGMPTFSTAPDSPLALAAAEGRRALVTLDSGVGDPRSEERDASLSLAGRLETVSREDCECCSEVRDVVTLRLSVVVLQRRSTGETTQVPLAAFRSPSHVLNQGYLQRSVEHAVGCHQDELRLAVSRLADLPMRDVLGVGLSHLRPGGVQLRWVDPQRRPRPRPHLRRHRHHARGAGRAAPPEPAPGDVLTPSRRLMSR